MTATNISQTKINILNESTINSIDAYKIFSSPIIIIKELVENSIDANADTIKIYIKSNLSSIEVHDNGSGIDSYSKESLCKRFHSSKIGKYDDIHKEDFNFKGFKGEALSILSFISKITIKTKVRQSSNQNKDDDEEGVVMLFHKSYLVNEARVKTEYGTIIKLDDIYHENLLLKSSLNPKKEQDNILKLIQSLSIYFPFIGFSMMIMKDNSSTLLYSTINQKYQSLRTVKNDKFDEKNKDNNSFSLQKLIINQVLNERIDIGLVLINSTIDSLNISYYIICNKPSIKLSSKYFLMCINNRILLNTRRFENVIQKTYEKMLVKNGNYFCLLSISLPSSIIDINCSSDKSNILILYENEILSYIENSLYNEIKHEIESVNIYSSEYVGFKSSSYKKSDDDKGKGFTQEIILPKDKVRSDYTSQTLEVCLSSIRNKRDEVFDKTKCKINNKNNESHCEYSEKSKVPMMEIDFYDKVDMKTIEKGNNKHLTDYSNHKNHIKKEDNQIISSETDLNIPKTKQIQDDNNEKTNKNNENLLQTFIDIIYKYENKEITKIIKNNVYIGIDQDYYGYLQYDNSLYIFSLYRILEEFIFYSILNMNQSTVSIDIIILNTINNDMNTYSIENVIEYAEELLEIDIDLRLFRKIDYSEIRKSIKFHKNLFEILNIEVDVLENGDIRLYSIPYIDINKYFGKENKVNINFYLPLIFYSFLRSSYNFYIKQKKNGFKTDLTDLNNVNFIVEIDFILSKFISNAILDVNFNEDTEFFNKLRLFFSLGLNFFKNSSKYVFRNGLLVEDYFEKIVDTQVLYTIFERC